MRSASANTSNKNVMETTWSSFLHSVERGEAVNLPTPLQSALFPDESKQESDFNSATIDSESNISNGVKINNVERKINNQDSSSKLFQPLPFLNGGKNELQYRWKRAYISQAFDDTGLCVPAVGVPIKTLLPLKRISSEMTNIMIPDDYGTTILKSTDLTESNIEKSKVACVKEVIKRSLFPTNGESKSNFVHGCTEKEWEDWWIAKSENVKRSNNGIWSSPSFWKKIVLSSAGTGCANFCVYYVLRVLMGKSEACTEELCDFIDAAVSKSSIRFLKPTEFSDTLKGLKLRADSTKGALIELYLAKSYNKLKEI